jgi:CHAT domain-containing protein/tetratricopeptide (TPR) repeat protein
MERKNVIYRGMNRGSAPDHSCLARSRSLSVALLGGGILALISLGHPSVGTAGDFVIGQGPPTASAAQEMKQGAARFQQGDFAQAAVHWMTAARLYDERGQSKEQSQALINLAHAFQQEGQVRRAQGTLQTALRLSEQLGDRLLTATILGQLGTTSHALGKDEPATEHLTKALMLAREEKQPALVAGVLNDLGNVLTARRQFAEAIDVYAESRSLAIETKQPALAATAQINGAMALLQNQQLGEAQQYLDQASSDVQALGDSRAKTTGLLNIGLGYQDLYTAVTSNPTSAKKPDGAKTRTTDTLMPGGPGKALLRQSSEAFASAGEVAARTGDARGESYAWGYLGGVLEREHRTTEALEYSRKASFAAQKVNAPESLYRWQWQTARLLKADGKEDEAVAAYQRAVGLLKPIRYEYSVGYQGRHHSFYDSVAPLFVEYEDVLLRRAATAKTPDQSERWLVQVKDTVETSHAAELQDYFQDDCVGTVASQRKDSTVPPGTMVVYPISFPDRLELLVETADGLKQVQVPVSGEKLTKEIRTFRRSIQDSRSQNYLPSAQTLYGWLVAPLQQDFQATGITTLVMVAEGSLRTIPMGALHDGRRFLVDTVAVAVAPSLVLTDMTPARHRKGNLLSVGLTEAVEGVSAPRYAEAEVQAIRTMYGGKLLMNKQFSSPSLEEEIKDQGVGIVHVATHPTLGREARDSFVLAHDGKISMDRLSQLVGLQQYRQQPLDLLTLSSCEIAAEDDRAALGLTGVAVKTGARTALASLWATEDETTTELVSEFYRQLQDPAISKAVALQRAQQKILSQRGHSHPSFWSAFILINNWM